MSDYTPSDQSVRIAFIYVEDGQPKSITKQREEAYERWLSEHDAKVRAEERERQGNEH